MRTFKINKNNIMFSVYYLLILFAYIGSSIQFIDFGAFSLFPFRILVFIIWGLLLISLLKNKKMKLDLKKVDKEILFLVFWLMYATFSIAWAKDIGGAVRDIFYLFNAFSIVFFSVLFLRRKKGFDKILRLIIGVFIVFSIIGIWEVITGNHLANSNYYGTGRSLPSVVFANTNNFSSFLTLVFPFLLALFRYKKNKLHKILSIVGMAAVIFLLIASGSRGNLLAVGVQILFLFLFLMNIKNKFKFILLGVIILPIILINFSENVTQIIQMFNSILNSISSGRGSGFIRLNLILNGLYFLYNSFGFGVGAGNIEFYMRNNAIFETFGIENMHNWWFEIITNYGIIIFMLYLMFFIRIFFKIYMIRKTENNKIFSEAILLSLVGFIFASISPSTFIAFRPQWIIIGIAIAYINSHKKDLIRT